MKADRIVCWFSCGAASAVATKLAIQENAGKVPLVVVCNLVREEHPDNRRFLKDCERWFGQPVEVLENKKYGGSAEAVWKHVRYMANRWGAPCTLYLKREMRRAFQKPGDLNVFGYTAEEQHRVDRFIDANPDARIWPVLVERGLSKTDCLGILSKAGIEIPVMYRLGYNNNNCIGCVKGGLGYWNKIRQDFPEIFERRAKLSRALGAKLLEYRGKRIFLDELPPGAGNYKSEHSVECGFLCELALGELGDAEK